MVGDDNYSHRRFILNWSLSHWLELQSISMVRIRISDEQYPVVPTGAKHQLVQSTKSAKPQGRVAKQRELAKRVAKPQLWVS